MATLGKLGRTTYGLLCNLVVPDAPISKGFKELKDELIEHFEPKPIIITHWAISFS